MSEVKKLPVVESDDEFIDVLCQHIIVMTDMLIKLDKESDHEEAMVSGLLLLYARFRQDNESWEGVTDMVKKTSAEVLEVIDDKNPKH